MVDCLIPIVPTEGPMIAITFPLAVTLGIAVPLGFTASYYHTSSHGSHLDSPIPPGYGSEIGLYSEDGRGNSKT